MIRSICYFKTRGESRATKCDKRGRPIQRWEAKGMKEESGGEIKVDQFVLRDLYVIVFDYLIFVSVIIYGISSKQLWDQQHQNIKHFQPLLIR